MPEMMLPAAKLLEFQGAVLDIQTQNYGHYMLHFKSIRQWYNDNGVRLESLKDRIRKLQQEFLEHEDARTPEDIKSAKPVDLRIKFIPVPPIPAVPAKYETKILRKKSLFKKEISEQVLISAEVPEKQLRDEPVFLPGKTSEEFDKRYKALLDQEVPITF